MRGLQINLNREVEARVPYASRGGCVTTPKYILGFKFNFAATGVG